MANNNKSAHIDELCLYFSKGFCKLGSECRFIHAKGFPKSINEPCRYFKEGRCQEGSGCPYLHSDSFSSKPWTTKKPTRLTDERYVPQDDTRSTIAACSTSSGVRSDAAIGELSTSMESLWGFKCAEDEGAYFYGNANKVATKDQPIQRNIPNWSQVASDSSIPSHILPMAEGKSKESCRYFQQGNCRFGDSCKYAHDISRSYGMVCMEGPFECGICFSDIEGEFGLLDGCSHVFCLACIRGWREKGLENGVAESVRRCPICRLPSNIVIPSAVVPSNQDGKNKIIAGYRSTLGQIACRHYSRSQECPFGTSCLYAHLLPDGVTPAPIAAPRLLVNDEGKANSVSAVRLSDFI